MQAAILENDVIARIYPRERMRAQRYLGKNIFLEKCIDKMKTLQSMYIYNIGFNTRNPHNLISIKRQKPSNRPVAPIRTLPNVMVLNARSIFNKVDELKAHIDNYKSDTLFVTETWLTESIPNEAVSISGLGDSLPKSGPYIFASENQFL